MAQATSNGLASRVSGRVHIIGAGLLGASIGLALRDRGIDVTLEDVSPTTMALAADYGAGRPRAAGDPLPNLVIVATPPDVVADVIERALGEYPDAVVTDVASIKLAPFEALQARGVDLTNYVGSHPMAGRERGGAIMARADLFAARPWVICRDEETPAAALSLVEITLHSGRNRIVRRMLAEVGHPVDELVRRQFGPLNLGTQRVGELRELSAGERGALLSAAAAGGTQAAPAGKSRAKSVKSGGKGAKGAGGKPAGSGSKSGRARTKQITAGRPGDGKGAKGMRGIAAKGNPHTR